MKRKIKGRGTKKMNEDRAGGITGTVRWLTEEKNTHGHQGGQPKEQVGGGIQSGLYSGKNYNPLFLSKRLHNQR